MGTTQTQAEGRFKKLHGGRWGLKVTSPSEVKSGTKARISKKGGETVVRTVDEVKWQEQQGDGTWLAICTQKRTKADEKWLEKRKAEKAAAEPEGSDPEATGGVDLQSPEIQAAIQAAVAAALAASKPKGKARKPKKAA